MDSVLEGFIKAGRHAFRTREYAALLGKPLYARQVLHRLKTRGELLGVRNGWWAFPDAPPEAVACEISAPAYLSFHSALHMHGLTTQVPNTIQLAVARFGRSYSILGRTAREYKVQKRFFNGFSAQDGVLIAKPEKALADCLNVPRACPEMVVAEAFQAVDSTKIECSLTRAGQRRLVRFIHD